MALHIMQESGQIPIKMLILLATLGEEGVDLRAAPTRRVESLVEVEVELLLVLVGVGVGADDAAVVAEGLEGLPVDLAVGGQPDHNFVGVVGGSVAGATGGEEDVVGDVGCDGLAVVGVHAVSYSQLICIEIQRVRLETLSRSYILPLPSRRDLADLVQRLAGRLTLSVRIGVALDGIRVGASDPVPGSLPCDAALATAVCFGTLMALARGVDIGHDEVTLVWDDMTGIADLRACINRGERRGVGRGSENRGDGRQEGEEVAG